MRDIMQIVYFTVVAGIFSTLEYLFGNKLDIETRNKLTRVIMVGFLVSVIPGLIYIYEYVPN